MHLSPPTPQLHARSTSTARRVTGAAALASLVLVALVLVGLPGAASGVVVTTATLGPVADATVDEAQPTRNLGSTATLLADADHGLGKAYWSYLRFDLGTSTVPISRASLRLWVVDPASGGLTVTAAPSTWSEAAITWGNRPTPAGTTVAPSQSMATGTWVVVDVRAALPASGSATLVLRSTSTNGVDFSSRTGANPPQLVVERGGTTASPTPVPSVTPRPSITPSPAPSATAPPRADIAFPARAAFYYPWFPETWTVGGSHVRYRPDLGYYSSDTAAVVERHAAAMAYANVDVAIASWWGQGTHTEGSRIPLLLDAAARSGIKVAFYYEKEGFGNPSGTDIAADLEYLQARYGTHPAAARVGGRLVVFVYNADDTTCSVVDRWRAANAGRAHVNLKVFSGFRSCAVQPDGWHQYGPASAISHQPGHSYSISPGFWRADEPAPRLARDLARWTSGVAAMAASGERWQLVTTFNEWGEGTSVEGAAEWSTSSGFGAYLDALHAVRTRATGPTPSPTPTPTTAPSPTPTPAPSASPGAVLGTVAVAGDIACDPASSSFNGGLGSGSLCRQLATSDELVDAGIVLTTGDNQYEDGTAAAYAQSYALSWGRFRSKTYPTPGNHEYHTPGATGYYQYFGARAGDPAKGYYSFDYAGWHFVSLNSNCSPIGGCGASSAQVAWLKADLAASGARCTIAFWHHPRWASGQYGNDSSVDAFWQALYAAGVELVLNGHDHNYQRYAQLTPAGTRDDARGIREIVAGMGGKSHYAVDPAPVLNREAADATSHGVLKLALSANSYSWSFVPVAGGTYQDRGSDTCH